MTVRHPIGVLIERDARRHDPRWRWHDGAMEWWDGFDLIYVPMEGALRRWRLHDWTTW